MKMEQTKKYQPSEIELARFAKAMGHPSRIAILEFLASRNSCYFGEFVEILPLTKATVSQHLSELKDAGLIQGEFDQPKVRYCINRDNWQKVKSLFAKFFDNYNCNKDGCCG